MRDWVVDFATHPTAREAMAAVQDALRSHDTPGRRESPSRPTWPPMSECVLDASALVLALSGKTADAASLRRQLANDRTHAPHLIDAEVGNVLRRHERRGPLSRDEALVALRVAPAVVSRRYPHEAKLLEMAWTLRANPSFYDGLYAALAALLDLPLLTADSRLSRAPNLPCAVDLV